MYAFVKVRFSAGLSPSDELMGGAGSSAPLADRADGWCTTVSGRGRSVTNANQHEDLIPGVAGLLWSPRPSCTSWVGRCRTATGHCNWWRRCAADATSATAPSREFPGDRAARWRCAADATSRPERTVSHAAAMCPMRIYSVHCTEHTVVCQYYSVSSGVSCTDCLSDLSTLFLTKRPLNSPSGRCRNSSATPIILKYIVLSFALLLGFTVAWYIFALNSAVLL